MTYVEVIRTIVFKYVEFKSNSLITSLKVNRVYTSKLALKLLLLVLIWSLYKRRTNFQLWHFVSVTMFHFDVKFWVLATQLSVMKL